MASRDEQVLIPPLPDADTPGPARHSAPPQTHTFRATFSALKERDYAWYFAGNLAFFMGMQMNLVVRGFLAFELVGTAAALGYISVAVALPLLITAPLGGVLADRVSKRTLLAVMQSLAAAANVVVAVLLLTDQIAFWHLLVVGVFTGTFFSVIMPTRQALAPQLVPQHKLMNAVTLQMGSMNLTRVVGPALGGVLIGPLGIGWVYLLMSGLFLTAVLTGLRLPVHGMVSVRHSARFREDLTAGFRFVWRSPVVRMLILTAMLMPLFGFPVQQILPVFVEDVYDRGPGALGVLASAAGVGGLIGALIAANLDNVRAKGRVMLVSALIMVAGFLAFATTKDYWVAAVLLAAGGIGSVLFTTVNNSVIQATIPEEYRARVMSFLMMSFGLMPLGVLPVTFAADAVGAQWAVAGSMLALLAMVLLVFSWSRLLRGLRLDPLGAAALSPVQAAKLVAEGKISQAEADRLTHETEGEPAPVRPA